MRDDVLQQKVIDELKWEPIINPAEIGVAVKEGVVTLSGKVQSWLEHDEAARIAWAAPGVSTVVNQIAVSS